MMGYGTGLGLGYGLSGWLMMFGGIALVVGLVLLVAWAVGRATGAASGTSAPTFSQPPAADALEVLRLRLARGEITIEEYTATKQVLEAGR